MVTDTLTVSLTSVTALSPNGQMWKHASALPESRQETTCICQSSFWTQTDEDIKVLLLLVQAWLVKQGKCTHRLKPRLGLSRRVLSLQASRK